MKYYTVALLRSSAPHLIYASKVALCRGEIVIVPLKSTEKEAVILEETEAPDFETQEIVSVTSKYFDETQLHIAAFISEYYFSSFSEAISLFVPHHKLDTNNKLEVRDEKLEIKENNKIGTRSEELGVGNEALGIKDVVLKRPELTPEQMRAYKALKHKERALLFGVTGSGKTEIFIARIADMLASGKSAMLLMPEISLTPQMQKRLTYYFGDAVAIWHSKITKKRKAQILEAIEAGEVRIVAGARSALFVPMPKLGLIVVDEEHDDSYKAHTSPRYHARDLALYVAKCYGAQVILASATPSVGSVHKYDTVMLEKPYIEAKKYFRFTEGEGITAPIIYALREHYEEGNQSLLFLPTRGNFKYLYCPACGKTHTCPYCSVGMALHRKKRYLKCHYCNFTEALRESCAYCHHTPLRTERMGTQEAKEIIENAIEGIRVELFDSDTITTAKKLGDALRRFERHESDLLLGTQMLSKGHDYPGITLSVITGLDHIMGMGDYRAREKAIALLFQIAGRSGRAKNAEVLIQCADPAQYEPYLKAGYLAFVKEELLFREIGNYPPFVSLARILIADKKDEKAAKLTAECVEALRCFAPNVEIVGHGRAPIERIAGKFRYTVLLRAKVRTKLLQALRSIKSHPVRIDMDPVEFS